MMQKIFIITTDPNNSDKYKLAEYLSEQYGLDIAYSFTSDEDISNFQPIPLTEEILEKNFTMYDSEYFIPEYPNHNPEANDYFSIYHYKGLSCIWKTEYIEDFYGDELKSVCVTSMKYVHDLQHFLKSCVINKEIIL